MATNKVIYGNTTLIDLTGDDVTADDVVQGKSFHLKSGATATGTLASKPAASGGTDLSLVTTGEKYDWNNKNDDVCLSVVNGKICVTYTT